jgi:hypothetical protein
MNCELEVRFNHRLTRQCHIISADRYTLSHKSSYVAEWSDGYKPDQRVRAPYDYQFGAHSTVRKFN